MTINELLSRFSIPGDRKGWTNLILEILLTGFAATLFLPLGEIRDTCMWGGFLLWLLMAEKNYLGKLARDRSFLLLLGLVGYALLSAAWSPDPKVSFLSWKATFDDYLAVIPVLVHFAYQPDFRARLIRIFSMAGLLSIFADCAQYAYEFASGAYREIDMRMAHYRRPLPLVLYAPFLLARAHETNGRQRVLWGASFLIAGLLLLPTGARGAWLAFAAAASIYFAFFLSFRQLLLIPVSCAAILGGAYAVLPDDSVVVMKVNEGFSTSSRLEGTWRPAIDLSLEHPLRGAGFGKDIYFTQFTESVAAHPHWLIFQEKAPSPHNFYLHLWFSLGGIGLVVCLTMFVHFIRAFLAGHVVSGSGQVVFVAFLASFTAHYVVRGMFETLTWVPLSILAGAAIATSLWVRESPQQS